MIFFELFYTFFLIGLFTFGGGYAMIPMIQEQVVSKGWISESNLTDFIAVSEATPGPFAINISTFVGNSVGGVFGAICSTIGVILPSIITCLVVAIMFSNGPLDVALASLNITEETAAAALPTVKAAAAFDYGMMALNVIERLLAMLLHISLTVIVFYGVVSGEKRYLPLAIVLHMLMDTFAALYQRGAVPLWSVEVWAAFWTVVSVVIAVRLYRKMAER